MTMANSAKKWTLAELHRLPNDGNKYELVRGDLFVTPPPSFDHESLASVLSSILTHYVHAQALGRVQHPRAVVRVKQSEVEPDMMVRPVPAEVPQDWKHAPVPTLVVEILSDSTRRRDHLHKRALYMDAGVREYWILDPEDRTIRVVRPDLDDMVSNAEITWQPDAATEPLVLDVRAMFTDALGAERTRD